MCGGSGGARAGREVPPVLGGIIVVSEVVEECEQPVRRTVAAGFSWEWCDPGESAFLDRHVGVEIGAARGFDSKSACTASELAAGAVTCGLAG
jgi:hypothetical protein